MSDLPATGLVRVPAPNDRDTSRSPTWTQSAEGALHGACAWAGCAAAAAAASARKGKVLRKKSFMVLLPRGARIRARDAAIVPEPAPRSCSPLVVNCYANVRPAIRP